MVRKIRLGWTNIYNVTSNQSLEKVLLNHSDLFRDELGYLNALPANIYIMPGAQPKFYKARPFPYFLKHRIELELQRLERSKELLSQSSVLTGLHLSYLY